jgi:hypothetical protein
MYAPNENSPPSRSVLMKYLVPSWEYRHLHGFAGVRVAAGTWLVVLGSILLAYGHRWGALLPVPAALLFWAGYLDMTVARSAPSRT